MLFVEEQRKSKNMSQEELAEKVGISRQYYNSIVNKRRKPSVALAKKLAEVLDLEWPIFFENVVNK